MAIIILAGFLWCVSKYIFVHNNGSFKAAPIYHAGNHIAKLMPNELLWFGKHYHSPGGRVAEPVRPRNYNLF